MAVAALPMAATHTGEAGSAAPSAAPTQRRPLTRARPTWNRSSSNVRRGSKVSAVFTRAPTESLVLFDGGCSLGAMGAISWGLHRGPRKIARLVWQCALTRKRQARFFGVARRGPRKIAHLVWQCALTRKRQARFFGVARRGGAPGS